MTRNSRPSSRGRATPDLPPPDQSVDAAVPSRAVRARARGRRRVVSAPDAASLTAIVARGGETGAAWDGGAADATPTISLEWIATDDVNYSQRRLAKENDRQHRQLMSSISTFGFLAPLVVSSGNEIIVGEKRLAAAIELGLKRLPAVRASSLTPLQIRQYRIADNRLNEQREWDADALREELAEIVILDPDISIEAMGFEIAEFDVALKLVDDGPDPDDRVGEPPKTGLSRFGDVWEVDRHLIAAVTPAMRLVLPSYGRSEGGVRLRRRTVQRKVDGHVGGKGAIEHSGS